MRRTLLAFGLMGSPLVLVVMCVAALSMICAATWLFSGTETEPGFMRIAALAPLQTPSAETEALGQASGLAPSVDEAPNAAAAIPTPVRSEVPLTQDQVNQARGFSLPGGSVNTITQEGVATRLVIPKLSLDSPIILSPIENQTWKVDHLGQDKVGHLEGTASPGSASNIVLAAHVTVSSDLEGPFINLSNLEAGDSIYVYYGDQIFEYFVDDYKTVDRAAVEVTFPSQSARVTLITCSNWSDDAERYLDRLVVSGFLGS